MKVKLFFLFIFIMSISAVSFAQKISNTGEGYTAKTYQSKDTPADFPFFDDFEDGDITDYDDLGGTTVTEASDAESYNGDYSLHIQGGSFGSGVQRSLNPCTPEYISLYVMSPDIGGSGGAASYIHFGDANGNGSIFFAIEGTVGPAVVVGTDWIGLGSVSENTWYFIEFTNIDFTNQEFDFYVDGGLVSEDIPFRENAADFKWFQCHNYYGAEGYWDDITISTGPVPNILTQPANQADICVGDEVVFFIDAENVDTYTWTVSDDGGSSWTDLSDDGTYSGADTYSLTVTTDISLEGYQYSCTISNDNGDDASDAATLTFETEVPTITCVGDQEKDAGSNHFYLVDGVEFDPTATDDNCEVESVINDFTDSETLDGAELPEGTTTITWTVTDIGGNEAECSFDVLVNAFVGINQLAEMGILVYPNPSDGIFTIETQDTYEMTITNVSGKIIEEQTINNQVNINISEQASGIYFIQFKNNEMVKTMQIIKE